jgi:Icc-related predicted phosphoesterase
MLIPIHNKNTIKRIDAFADTHGRHREYHCHHEQAADILVCAGDVCDAGNEAQLRDFFTWFAAQPAKHKLFVPGNHDLPFDIAPEYAARYIPDGVIFIENGGVILDGVHFYVLPVRWLMHEPLHLPQNVDVLVTHGAPLYILDENGRWGCPILRGLVEKSQPKIHIFGHAHNDGQKHVVFGNTSCYNVAI